MRGKVGVEGFILCCGKFGDERDIEVIMEDFIGDTKWRIDYCIIAWFERTGYC